VAKIDFIEKRKISQLLNNSGYVLDFTNETYGRFVYEKTGVDLYSKYGLSKGKNLEAIISNENDSITGKLLIELLRYMREIGYVKDDNRALFNDCIQIGNRLLGRQPKVTMPPQTTSPVVKYAFDYAKYLKGLQALSESADSAQARGYAFEKYLNELFKANDLDPRGAFKITSEQIDGSFILRDEVYLLEAKWTSKVIDKADLVVFNNKVLSKSGFTRGLFISYSGYSEQALSTLSRGMTVNIILMTVQELAIAMQRNMLLPDVLWNKVRALAEAGDFNKSVFEM
jgi:hypothetical protein